MSDNKSSTDGRDRSKVDANDANEVEFVHRQFPHLQHGEVLDAIKSQGPDREKIYEYLRNKK